MSDISHVGVGIIGLGFMGATHLRAYQAAREAGFQCGVVAVCDRNPQRLRGRTDVVGNIDGDHGARVFDPAQVRTCTSPRDLLADGRVNLVSICTHTDSHVELALAALQAGKHVLVEKPVALTSVDVRTLADAAERSGLLCMPAMCMRFWPGWTWLRERVRDHALGAVRSATFQRLGSAPAWATDFYSDLTRSGGTLFDLHIHDADFICWCFGPPERVTTTGSPMHVTTIYHYGEGREGKPRGVVAEGGQDYAPGFGFRMRYTVAFEHATAEFDLGRTPTLFLYKDGQAQPVELPRGSGYDNQARHLVDAILGSRPAESLASTMRDAVAVTELLEAEVLSLSAGGAVPVHSRS